MSHVTDEKESCHTSERMREPHGWTESLHTPLTEEIRLQIFGSPDLSVFLIDRLSDRDSVYSSENLFGMLGTPMKTFDMYGDSGENLLDILAVVMI